jgi:hypothetical protein
MTEEQPAFPMKPLREAAVATGRHPEALRSLIRRGRLKAVRGNDGTTLVEVPDWLSAGHEPQGAEPMAGMDGVAAELREELTELKTDLARAEAERDAVKAAAETEKAALRELIAALQTELAYRRRPLWLRWFGRG